MKKAIKRAIPVLAIMGCIYLNLELIMRAIGFELNGCLPIKPISLCGWTSLWMFPIGGLCGLFVGVLNERGRKLKLIIQALIGTLGIYSIELISGLICNVWLGFGIWDYSHLPLNIMGQVTLLYFPVWFLLTPLAMWVDDIARHIIYDKEKPCTLFVYYKRLFTLKK